MKPTTIAELLTQPELFCIPSKQVQAETLQHTKSMFDAAAACQVIGDGLDQLVVDGFDMEQIWQQMKLQNDALMKDVAKSIRIFKKQANDMTIFVEDEKEEELEMDTNIEMDENAESEDISDQDSEAEDNFEPEAMKPTKSRLVKPKKARDEVEDGFFDWDEMEHAAEEEEQSGSEDMNDVLYNSNDDISDIDEDEDEDATNAKTVGHDDFFDQNKSDDESSSEIGSSNEPVEEPTAEEAEEEAERGVMSSFQRRQAKLKLQVAELEKEALQDRSWELQGEVQATARPENSLLGAQMDYDRPTKTAPTITPEITMELEDLIKKRILDEDFDDVVRKLARTEKAQKQAAELSQEKSKEGLGEIYEKEYMKNALGFEESDAMKQEQAEIQVMFDRLCWKLDALSNFYYTPKPAVKEVEVKPAVPAIAMEEVVPMGVSDANLLAPEEVYEKKRGREAILQSKEEMSQTERKATRQSKKAKRRKLQQEKHASERLAAKLNPGLGNNYEKKKILESLEAKNVVKGTEVDTMQFTKSSEFFSHLQNSIQKDK